MGRKKLSLKPVETKNFAADTVKIVARLALLFRNNAQQAALWKVMHLLNAPPQDRDMEGVVPGYNSTIRSRKPHKFHIFMAALTTILNESYWLHFNPKHEDTAKRFKTLRTAYNYLVAFTAKSPRDWEVQGDVGRGFTFKLQTPKDQHEKTNT